MNKQFHIIIISDATQPQSAQTLMGVAGGIIEAGHALSIFASPSSGLQLRAEILSELTGMGASIIDEPDMSGDGVVLSL